MINKDTQSELARKLPPWVVSLLAISIVTYVFAMSAVAIFTERNVSFFPPEIGEGPKQEIVSELKLLRSEVLAIRLEFVSSIDKVNLNIAEARKKSGETYSRSISEKITWENIAEEFESDRKLITEDYIKHLDNLNKKIDSIESNLKSTLLL